ncbi:hypothetical protein [Burkholderia cenocepacia]|nr:hypothetical protein [Burkholderia cenocepacia]MBR7979866.1 hypothetical protein [Burkholderia cenocepacia]
MNEQQYACAVARLAARYAACFPVGRVTGRAARPVRPTVPRFKEFRHV